MDGFTVPLYHWFQNNMRELPWRNTRDPYKIWVSEIILQQTRIMQGISYYERFIDRFGSVEELAEASEDEVLGMWHGLGYYSRARNLHFTAKEIVNKYRGTFPDDYNEILKLKGIGEYTAGAIASIAFGQEQIAVDGNVVRLLSRFFGIEESYGTGGGKKMIDDVARQLIKGSRPGFHNQALMEFGALQCLPKSPNCSECPLLLNCYAFKNKCIDRLPVTAKKPVRKNRFFNYFLFESADYIWIEKRKEKDIWQNLYQLPLTESIKRLSDEEIIQNAELFKGFSILNVNSVSPEVRHILSHRNIFARMVHFMVECFSVNDRLIRINKKDISKFAFPRLVEMFLQNTGLTGTAQKAEEKMKLG